MIDTVYVIHGGVSFVSRHEGSSKWKCGKCNRGVIWVYRGENGQGFEGPYPKKCKVCRATVKVTEVSR